MNRVTLHRLTRARRQRQDLTAFDALIAAPASGSVTLPANGRFAFVALDAVAAGTAIAEIVGPAPINLVAPEMVAGQALVLDYLEKATVVTLQPGFELYVLTPNARSLKIASP